MRNKKCFIAILIIINSIFFTIVSFITIKSDYFIKNAQQVYADSILSIVELKAFSQNVGESFGTAEFIDDEGYLITNAHVIAYTQLNNTYTFESFFIRFIDEDDYHEVSLIKFDENIDLALLKINEINHKYKSVKTGNSSLLKSGETVFAIGNSINYGLSISKGIIGIPIIEILYENLYRNVIQCDINITEGNSGGALLNEKGELIGITTQILTSATIATLAKDAYFLALANPHDGSMYFSPLPVTEGFAIDVVKCNSIISIYTFLDNNAKKIATLAGNNAQPYFDLHHNIGYFDHYHKGDLPHSKIKSHVFFDLPKLF